MQYILKLIKLVLKLHQINISHNDIWALNILIDNNSAVHLIDFDTCSLKVQNFSDFKYDYYRIIINILRCFKVKDIDEQLESSIIFKIKRKILEMCEFDKPKDYTLKYIRELIENSIDGN